MLERHFDAEASFKRSGPTSKCLGTDRTAQGVSIFARSVHGNLQEFRVEAGAGVLKWRCGREWL